MKNWTDSCINWHQLPGTEVRRLVATWGMTPEQIAKYDRKHGYTNSAPKAEANPATKAEATKAPAKKAAAKPVRQKHTGADGEVKFVEHRNLYVGFYGGRVVVTKRTEKQCREFLEANHGVEY